MKKKNIKSTVTTAENLEARFDAGENVLDYFDFSRASHPNWGGRRNGSGRKTNGHVRLQLSVPPQVRAEIERLARREGKTLSEMVASRF